MALIIPPSHPLTSGSAAEAAVLRRAVVITGLLGIAVIHLLDLQGKFEETPYVGVLFVGLILSSLLVADLLARKDSLLFWLAAAGLAAATLAGYAISRTAGLPGAPADDIGNWLEPLGLASLMVEGLVVLVAAEHILQVRTARGQLSDQVIILPQGTGPSRTQPAPNGQLTTDGR